MATDENRDRKTERELSETPFGTGCCAELPPLELRRLRAATVRKCARLGYICVTDDPRHIDVDEYWLRDWADDGFAAMAEYLARHALFARYLLERDQHLRGMDGNPGRVTMSDDLSEQSPEGTQ